MRNLPPCRVVSILIAIAILAVTPAAPRSAPVEAVPAPPRRVVLLPFVPRGAPPSGWLRITPLLEAEITGRGIEIVATDRIEDYLREHRLRDTSILSREELAALASTFGADRLMTGSIYRWEEGANPVVSLAGRIIDRETGRVVGMAMTVLEGSSLVNLLGTGGPVTIEWTMQAAVRDLVESLLATGQGGPRRDMPKLLRRSVLAPEPLEYLSPGLTDRWIGRVTVMPFRNNADRPGAGHVAADAFTWCLLEAGGLTLADAGDATRRLLERGWRTGRAVGRQDVVALHEDPGVDAVLMGSIDNWDDGSRRSGVPPSITLSARLLDGITGDILWTATHERRGDETRSLYQIGNVRLPEALVARSACEMLAPLLSTLEKSSKTIGENSR